MFGPGEGLFHGSLEMTEPTLVHTGDKPGFFLPGNVGGMKEKKNYEERSKIRCCHLARVRLARSDQFL